MNQVELYDKPRDILKFFDNDGFPGMSKEENGFLCGLIKKKRPKKILEIGLSAGATTTVIMNCLEEIECNSELFSVDLLKRWYIDTSKKTGYVSTEYIDRFKPSFVNYKEYLGDTVAKVIDDIGGGIDMVILDTMHSLPGELLDLISVYKYLDDHATVIFHDVVQSQLGIQAGAIGAPFQYASILTLIALNGKKYWNSTDNISGYMNIGAVELDKTNETLDSLFMALFMNWNYLPDDDVFHQYKSIVYKLYGDYYGGMLENAYKVNRYSMYKRSAIEVPIGKVASLIEILKNRKIYLYGNGHIANEINEFFNNRNLRVAGRCVTNPKTDGNEIGISDMPEVIKETNAVIVLALDSCYHQEVLREIYRYKLEEIVFPTDGVGFREFLNVVRYENSIHDYYKEANNDGYAQWIDSVALLNK